MHVSRLLLWQPTELPADQRILYTSADGRLPHEAGIYGECATAQHGWQSANTNSYQYQYPAGSAQQSYSENHAYGAQHYCTDPSVNQLPSVQPGDNSLSGSLPASSGHGQDSSPYNPVDDAAVTYAVPPPLPQAPPPSAPPPPIPPPPPMPPSEYHQPSTQPLPNISGQSVSWANSAEPQLLEPSTQPSSTWAHYQAASEAGQHAASAPVPQPSPTTTPSPSTTTLYAAYNSQFHSNPSAPNQHNVTAPPLVPSSQYASVIPNQNHPLTQNTTPAYPTSNPYSHHVSGPSPPAYPQPGYIPLPHVPPQHATSIHSIPPPGPLQHSSHLVFSPQHASIPQHMVPHVVPPAPASFGPVLVPPRGARLPEAPRTVTDISQLMKQPGRGKRANKILFILRGLPGSGKSMIAKKIKDLEVENGGTAPRIHSIDDYFLTEVEKEVADEEGTGRKGRKRKIVENEYCYDARAEGTYQKQLLKAVTRTLEEGRFKMVVVDACNVKMDDVKEYWGAAQRTGYEPYVLQPLTMDPELCHQRGVHNRSLEDVKMLWQQWEPTPPLYAELSMGSIYAPTPDQIEDVDMESDEEDDTLKGAGAKSDPKVSHSSRWEGDNETKDDTSADKGFSKSSRKKTKVVKSDAEFLNDLDVILKPDKGEGSSKRKSSTDKEQVQPGMEAVSSGRAESEHDTVPKRKSGRKSVRWADEVDDDETGFRIGPPKQLEQTFVLEGLGPPKEHPTDEGAPHGSFQEQVKREQAVFRSIMFGRAGAGGSSSQGKTEA